MGDPVGKRQAQAAATQEQLLVAARQVFATRGYQATTVGAITQAANTAHGTFYLYFRNKEDAFQRVMQEITGELYDESRAPWQPGDTRASVRAALHGFLEVFVRHRDLWRCVLEGSFTTPAIEAAWLDIRGAFVARTARHLRQLRDDGEIRDLDPDIAANALGAMVEWAATTHFVLDRSPASFDDVLETLTDLWYHAVYAAAMEPAAR
jgi:AcrR family transcriptional regulator